MKTICLLTPMFLFLISCNTNKKKHAYDDTIPLYGNVKKVTTLSYNAIDSFGEIIPTTKLPDSTIELYNNKRQIIETATYNNDTLDYKTNYVYNNNQLLHEYRDDDYKYRTSYKYNSKDLVIEENQYYDTILTLRKKFKYNDNDNLTELYFYENNGNKGNLIAKHVLQYEKNNNCTSSVIYCIKQGHTSYNDIIYPADSISFVFEYDDSWNKIKSVEYQGSTPKVCEYNTEGLLIKTNWKTYNYEYDSKKNWTKCIEYSLSEHSFNIKFRKIEYY